MLSVQRTRLCVNVARNVLMPNATLWPARLRNKSFPQNPLRCAFILFGGAEVESSSLLGWSGDSTPLFFPHKILGRPFNSSFSQIITLPIPLMAHSSLSLLAWKLGRLWNW